MTARRTAARVFASMISAFIVMSATSSCERPTNARLDLAATYDSGTAAVNGTRLYYEALGAGEPVILLQGGNLPLEMWDDQFVDLAESHRVVRYDARGFGRSGPKTGRYASDEDLFALLQHLKIPKASLVGLSLGGRVAVDFSLVHPEMVDRLVLAGPGLSGFVWSDAREPWVDSAMAAYQEKDSVRISLLWLESGYMKPAMRDPMLAGRLRALTIRNASMWMQPDSERTLTPPAIGRLASIRAPVLVMIGTLEVPDIQKIVDTLEKTVPEIRRVVLPDAGHMLNLERPAEFTRAVLEFLRR